MKCPVCPESVLVMTDRSGIEIDYCPTCRGVWLDRGELDKIVERSAVATPVVAAAAAPTSRPAAAATTHSEYHSKYHQPANKKKKSSFLGEIFDF